ncbi:alpha/beta hydrolase [Vallitalea longa]|uniref:Alpha/beta hydrolase n=1 Tax=Vallitalea longa TaxID=2936439 RepID=A0A9W5YFJ2_9FIRM|nr:alpha/beta hydrolase [Vallitalea longa]GKX30268.1 alpha/beta hydrolase [Vallitalea longa]
MFIKINGITIFYKKSGHGKPLIMLHGNGETHEIFNRSISLLNKYFTVYAIDFRDHGNSSKVSELHYDDHAADIYEFINKFNIKKPVYYGFSDGGIVGLILASQYTDLFSRLIVSGPNINPKGLRAYAKNFMKLKYALTKSQKVEMMLKEPDIPLFNLSKIDIPTNITGGSIDVISRKHLKLIQSSIRNSVLKIFKYHTHSSYIVNSEIIGKYIIEVCNK